MKKTRIPVLIQHDAVAGPIGWLELIDTEAITILDWSQIVFAPGYTQGVDGKIELLEVSIVVAPQVSKELKD